MNCTEPVSRQEYELRYMDNYKITGFGLDGTTNHFPCPFCAHPEWKVVRVIDFGVPEKPGVYHSDPYECECCGRAARYVTTREAGGALTTRVEQTAGPDAPEWVPIPRAE